MYYLEVAVVDGGVDEAAELRQGEKDGEDLGPEDGRKTAAFFLRPAHLRS